MRICNSCGIGIGDRLSVKYKTILYCKTCYKQYQKEQFAWWYAKQPRKNYELQCVICKDRFNSTQPKANVCSEQCKKEKKRLANRKYYYKGKLENV